MKQMERKMVVRKHKVRKQIMLAASASQTNTQIKVGERNMDGFRAGEKGKERVVLCLKRGGGGGEKGFW